MSAGKIGSLVLYLVLVVLVITQAGTLVATLATWSIFVLVVVHAVEMAMYYRLCQQAQGSTAGNLLQVFLFGYFHMIEMKAAVAEKAD